MPLWIVEGDFWASRLKRRNSWAEINPELVAEAKRLCGTGRRRDRSLREIAAELQKLGFVNERGVMFSASSVASMLAT